VTDGRAVLFADDHGQELLPSVVGIDASGTLLVGRGAKNRRILDPEGTVVSIKRQMGKDTRVRVGPKELAPPQVSALILGALLDRAEARLGMRPKRAVITVPAYFGDAERQATRDAGELAGLVVERLVNEPTAAAMTYQTGSEERVLVYDLGGGTFDVSILDRDADFLEIRASRGDTHLGGDDIDDALTELLLARLGAGRAVVERDRRGVTRLVEAVERTKVALSERHEVRLSEPFLAGEGAEAIHLDSVLTRVEVESVARPFLERTLRCIDQALRDAKMRPADLDRVLLVGGSSKMPFVAQCVAEHLGRPAMVDIDADRAVALGASLLAGRIAGAAVNDVLVDITPHTLSIGALDSSVPEDADLVAAPVIPRDTVVPVERTTTVFTHFDNQPATEIPIVQGEEELVADNTYLGEVVISDLPPSSKGSPVEVTFRLDLSGVLHVTASHVPSGRAAAVTIANGATRLTAQRREAARREVEMLRARTSPAKAGEATESDVQLGRALLARAKRALEAKTGNGIAEKAASAMEALAAALTSRSAETSALSDALADALLDLVCMRGRPAPRSSPFVLALLSIVMLAARGRGLRRTSR